MNVNIKKLHPKAVIPEYKTVGAAGFDLVAVEDVVAFPMNPVSVGTGLAFEIPVGYELEIRSRSGLAFKSNVYAYNGTVDSDYRGEVKIQLTNMGNTVFLIEAGDRIAQGIIKPIQQVKFVEIDSLSETERGEKGFGSTGVSK